MAQKYTVNGGTGELDTNPDKKNKVTWGDQMLRGQKTVFPKMNPNEMAKKHLKLSLKWKGDVLGVLETRRHYGNYFKGVENFKSTKTKILTEKDPDKIIRMLDSIKERSEKVEALT